jgi:cytoplasmic iron level regulating protein YaaA (DUF328/UPF0246 family)
MLSVISPAKKLNFDEVLDVKDSSPKFQKDANYLAKIARTLSVSDLKNMMKISEELAVLNQKRFQAFSDQPEEYKTKQAALAFAGDTYTGLDAGNLSSQELGLRTRSFENIIWLIWCLASVRPYSTV